MALYLLQVECIPLVPNIIIIATILVLFLIKTEIIRLGEEKSDLDKSRAFRLVLILHCIFNSFLLQLQDQWLVYLL